MIVFQLQDKTGAVVKEFLNKQDAYEYQNRRRPDTVLKMVKVQTFGDKYNMLDRINPVQIISSYQTVVNENSNQLRVENIQYIDNRGRMSVKVQSMLYDKLGQIQETHPNQVDVRAQVLSLYPYRSY